MSHSRDQIVDEMVGYMREWSGAYNSWYVGVANDAERRLFNEHRVDRHRDGWIYDTASLSETAGDVEDYLVNELGTDGGVGGRDQSSDQVYAYKKNHYTRP